MEYLWDLVLDHPEPDAAFEFTKRNGDLCRITHAGIEINGEAYTPPGRVQTARHRLAEEKVVSDTTVERPERCEDTDLGGSFAKTLPFDSHSGLPDANAHVLLGKVSYFCLFFFPLLIHSGLLTSELGFSF
jgi:hypothetical protein